MKVSVHLREGENLTNVRSTCIAQGLEDLGHKVVRKSRGEGIGDADLVVQTGFARSTPLLDAIGKGVPYLIMEAPFTRDFYDVHGVSSWGYNGLAGGAFHHEAPEEDRPKPNLLPLKKDGGVLVIGQKPTDHSIRGVNHAAWILQKMLQNPDAEFRPHPLTVPEGSQPPIAEALEGCKRVITWTSTVGADALIAGCESIAEHPGSIAYGVEDRESWLHEISWAQFTHGEYAGIGAKHVIGGYEEARELAKDGKFEIPRLRVDNQAVFRSYYATLEAGGLSGRHNP